MEGLSDFLPELYPSSVEDLETVTVIAGHIRIYRKLFIYIILYYLIFEIVHIFDLALQKCLCGVWFPRFGPMTSLLAARRSMSYFKITTDDSSRWGWVGDKRPRAKKILCSNSLFNCPSFFYWFILNRDSVQWKHNASSIYNNTKNAISTLASTTK